MSVAASPYATIPRLLALSLAQIVGWGTLYYSFIVAAPKMATSTGWPLTAITGLFSGGLVCAALMAMVVGRLLDRRGPRIIVTAGSAVGVLGLILVSQAGSLAMLGVAFLVCAVAQASVFYDAAFTIVTHRYQDLRRKALAIVTIAGGLASTIFAPLVAVLLSALGWSGTYLVLAAILAAVNLPLYWFSLEPAWHVRVVGHPDRHDQSVSAVVRSARFWRLVIAMVAISIALFSVTLNSIPLFMERGLTFELAAVALGLIGAGQLLGRILFMVIPHGRRAWVPLAAGSVAGAVALAMLGLVPGPAWLLILIGVATGSVRGVMTLVHATAVSDRWGTLNYGAVNGIFSAPIAVALALTPAIGPLVASVTGSFTTMALVMAGVALVAALIAPMT